MPDELSEVERKARTPGRRLHDRLEESEVSDGSKYYALMNPAVKAAWERLATDIDKEMGGLGARLNDAERDREQAEARERALREALTEIAGEYGCGLIEPPDVSLPPEGDPCRERRPDEPETWCVQCVASAALAAFPQSDDERPVERPS